MLVLLILSTVSAAAQDNYFKKSNDGKYYWQKVFLGTKQDALNSIYTNFTIRNNVIAEIDSAIYLDFEDDFLFNPGAVLSSTIKLRAKIRVEFKPDKYRVTILKMGHVTYTQALGEVFQPLSVIEENRQGYFNKAKKTLNRDLPKMFENQNAEPYNSDW